MKTPSVFKTIAGLVALPAKPAAEVAPLFDLSLEELEKVHGGMRCQTYDQTYRNGAPWGGDCDR